MLKGKTVVVGVTGGIAAFKSAQLVSDLVKEGCDVHTVMTKNALNFINPITFETRLTEIFSSMSSMLRFHRELMCSS